MISLQTKLVFFLFQKRLLLLQAPGSVRLIPCFWLVGLTTPDISLEPFRERLAKFLAPSAFIYFNVSYGEVSQIHKKSQTQI